MSWVTNIILHLDSGDDRHIAEINKFFGDQKGFVSIDDTTLPRGWYGGCKMMEAELYLGAFNHIDVAALIDHPRNIHFNNPEAVQLIVKDQEEEVFSIKTVFPKRTVAQNQTLQQRRQLTP
ncbi:MAG: hypothetical protein ACK4UN_11485, partial [Limisphaerales bacterium]